MALPRSLSSSVLKYQDHRPGSSNAGPCDFAGPATRIPGGTRDTASGPPVAEPDLYLGRLPDDYVPDVGVMSVREPDYEPYEVSFAQAPPPDPPGIRDLPPDLDEPPVKYSDGLMTQALWEHLMRLEGADLTGRLDLQSMVETKTNPGLPPGAPGLEEITHNVAPQGGPGPEASLPPPAIGTPEQCGDSDRLPAAELPPTRVDYVQTDPREYFEQQMSMLDSRFGPLEAMLFDRGAPMEAVFPVPGTLFDPSQPLVLPSEPEMPRLAEPGLGPPPGS